MNGSLPKRPIEPRWPVILAIVAVFLLVATLHQRIQIFPDWFRYTAGVLVLVAIAAVPLTGAKARWRKIERIVILFFVGAMEAGILLGLTRLIREMVNKTQGISGLQLFVSSIVIWVTNVLMFSLLYWQIDRGGPEARIKSGSNNGKPRPDWLFPQTEATGDSPVDWHPTFVDYLFLAFTTATAFSPTDALPLTARAKLLMMIESSISLMTIVIVAARAINILGS